MHRHLTNQDIIRPQSGDRTLAQLDSTLGPFLLTEGEAKSLNESIILQMLRLSQQRVDGGQGRLTAQDIRRIKLLASGQRYEEGFSIQFNSRYTAWITRIPGRFKWRNGRWEVYISPLEDPVFNGIFYIHPEAHGGYTILNTVTGNLYKGTMFYFSRTEITAAARAGEHLLPPARTPLLVGSRSFKF